MTPAAPCRISTAETTMSCSTGAGSATVAAISADLDCINYRRRRMWTEASALRVTTVKTEGNTFQPDGRDAFLRVALSRGLQVSTPNVMLSFGPRGDVAE